MAQWSWEEKANVALLVIGMLCLISTVLAGVILHNVNTKGNMCEQNRNADTDTEGNMFEQNRKFAHEFFLDHLAYHDQDTSSSKRRVKFLVSLLAVVHAHMQETNQSSLKECFNEIGAKNSLLRRHRDMAMFMLLNADDTNNEDGVSLITGSANASDWDTYDKINAIIKDKLKMEFVAEHQPFKNDSGKFPVLFSLKQTPVN